MGIGQFLAAALGTMAVGGASGMAQMQIRDKMDAKKFTMQILQKGIFDHATQGYVPPDDAGKEAFGPLWKQVGPILQGMAGAARARSQSFNDLAFGQQGGGGTDAVAAPSAAPSMQMGGGEAPSLAPTPSAAPQAGAILGAMAGGPATAAVMGRPSPPVTPQPEPTATPFEQTIRPQLEPGARAPGMLREGVGPLTVPSPMGGSLTIPPSDAMRVNSVLKWGYSVGASPDAVVKQAAKQGLRIPKEQYDQLGESYVARSLPAALAQVAITGAVGPEARQDALRRVWAQGGYLPNELKAQALPDQAASDAWALRFLATQGQGVPLAKVYDAMATLGITVSPDARKQMTESATAKVTATALANDPTLQGNPSKLARIVWEGLGYSAQSPEATALMNQLAPVSPATAEQLTIQGKAQPLAANVGAPPAPAGAPTGDTGVTSALDVAAAKRGAEVTAVRETEHLAAAHEVGKATGERKARDITTVNDEKTLMGLVDRQGNPPPPGMTQNELDGKIADGTYGRLSVDRKVFVGFNQVVGTINSYEQILARPNNIFTRPAWARFLSTFASGPWQIGVAGFDTNWEMPAIPELRKRLNLSDQDIADIQQVVTIRNLGAAHIRALDEKGQGMTAKLYQAGIKSFPGTMDDVLSANAKIAAFRIVLKTRLDEAVSWTTPKGPSYLLRDPISKRTFRVTPEGSE